MPCNSINSTIEIFTTALLLVLLVTTGMKKREKTKMDCLFMVLLILHTVNTLGDLVSWRFTYKPGMSALVFTSMGNFTTYFFGAMAYFVFLLYVYLDATSGKWPKGWSRCIAIIIVIGTIFNMGLTLYNYGSGVLYTIDRDNAFIWGPWCSVPDNVVLAQIVLTVILMFCNVKMKDWKRLLPSVIYLLPAFFAAIIENWQSTLMLLYPAVAIAYLLIYVMNQQKQENQLMQRELELSESRIKVMVSQIQPHFLYNSLNSIYHLCDMDAGKAQQAISDFSDYLRMNLRTIEQDQSISFKDELKHVQTYLQLEKMRYEELLNVEYNIEIMDFLIPPLTVQPMVENAVKHGLSHKKNGGTIIIASKEIDDMVEITVSDNGNGFAPKEKNNDKSSHIGIQNTKKRLESICGGTMSIISEPGAGTTITIRIPKEKCR